MGASIGFVGVVALAVIAGSIYALLHLLHTQRRRAEVRGVQWVQALRMLLMHVQRHRGLVSMYHNGELSVMEEIVSLRETIARDLGKISFVGEWINENQDWQGLTQHWARLSVGCLSMTSEKSFDQHCRIIVSVLAILEDVANYHYLNRSNFNEVKVLWHELLLIGELVGQSRALGVRILGYRSGDAQLSEHKKRIQAGLCEIEGLLGKASTRKKLSTSDMAALVEFIAFVRIQLIDNIGPVSANEYFTKATDTIDLIYERFDIEMQLLCRKLGIDK